MQYQILVEHPNQNGFVASVLGVPDCVVTGRTEEEAVTEAKAVLGARLAQGKVVTVEVPVALENPLLKHAGRFKDDPTFDDFLAEIEKYRRELDADDAAA